MAFGYTGILDGTEDVVWKTEGLTDTLAILSLNPPDGHTAVCNACGAQERPGKDAEWFLEMFRGAEVFVIHDCDQPGQAGAIGNPEKGRPGWATALARYGAIVRNVVLPYPIEENHGKDVRDWIGERLNAGRTPESIYEELLEYARTSPNSTVVELAQSVIERIESEEDSSDDGSAGAADDSLNTIEIEEADHDPHRLARVNLSRYEDDHGGKLRFWQEEWWRYRDGYYRRIGKEELKAKVARTVKIELDQRYRERVARGEEVREVRPVTRGLVSNVIGAMESETVLSSSIDMPCWLPDRSERHYLSMKNGILDLGAVFASKPFEECLFPHTPDWFSTTKLEYGFDPAAKCPRWEEYLDFSMEGDADSIDLLQEWAGYLLTNGNEYQKFLALEGEGGNGKSVYFAGITAMLGIQNVSHVAMENFGGRFDLGSTVGKAANISGDAGEIDNVAEGILKQFCGGDVMQFDRKNLPPISVRPTAKLMAAWNSRPRIKDRSQGLWRRMLLVPFLRRIPPERIVRGMDSWRWWLDSGEATGILNWALIGLDRLNRNQGFTTSNRMANAIDSYRTEENSARQFLMDEVDWIDADQLETEKQKPLSDQIGIRCETLYKFYREWCQSEGTHPLSNKNFGKEVKRMFGDVKYRRQVGSERYYVYRLIGTGKVDF